MAGIGAHALFEYLKWLGILISWSTNKLASCLQEYTSGADKDYSMIISIRFDVFVVQLKLQNEMNLRKNAESLAASAEDKASLLEGKSSCLAEGTERENKNLRNELVQLQRESKLSISRISADVRI